MEEDDLDGLDVISNEVNQMVLPDTCLSSNSIENDKNKQSTSSAISIKTQVSFLGYLIHFFFGLQNFNCKMCR